MTDLIILLLVLVLVFALGALWGAWHTTNTVIQRMVDDPNEFKRILAQIDRIQTVPENQSMTQLVRAEWHDDLCYLYDTEDHFLAQGTTLTQALELAQKRYPQQAFRLNSQD